MQNMAKERTTYKVVSYRLKKRLGVVEGAKGVSLKKARELAVRLNDNAENMRYIVEAI
jgi:hypothetical protein